MKRSVFVVLSLAFVLALAPASLFAKEMRGVHGGGHEQVGFGDTIIIAEGDTASDVVCAFCTVRVQGEVTGDLVTFFGTVNVADGRSLDGDAVIFGGKLKLANESHVGGDLVLFGGDFDEAPSASVHGDHVILAGGGWLLIALLPFLVPIGVIWMIVHVVRRSRYRFPAYPGGRRF